MPKKKNKNTAAVENVDQPKGQRELGDNSEHAPTIARAHITKEAERILSGLGITPAEMARESTEELMTPKMAVVGCLQTIQRISEACVNNVMNSPGALNVPNLLALFGGLRGTLMLAEKVTMDYTRVQAAMRAKDLIDAIQKKMNSAETSPETNPRAPGVTGGFSIEPLDDNQEDYDTETLEEGVVAGTMDDTDEREFNQIYENSRTKKPKILN